MMKSFEGIRDLLPESAIAIVDVIGLEATMQLVEVLGGVPMPVNKGVLARGDTRLDMLRQAVGEENTRKLMSAFGGEEIYIPNCYHALRECFWRQFLSEFDALRDEGVSVLMALTRLCPQHKVSYKQAMKVISARKQNARDQPTLPFD
ncbi:Mor transcription activator family protein [Trabulsiella odontotermitis]|nr:Mor transcription activator family protein [Trabulsiella odontotermitis]